MEVRREDYKNCTWCEKEKELTEFYTQKKKRKDGSEYIYYHPECKVCTKERAIEWQKSNPNKFKRIVKRRDHTEKAKMRRRDYTRKRHKLGYFVEYQRINKDKIRKYNEERRHKNHQITQEEWSDCKKYFNNSCAYCGISENEHRVLYNQDLHKEHVDHEGANDLSNCVPSCRSCNSQKHVYLLESWYDKNNGTFTQERLEKIYSWLNNDYKSYIENK